MNQNVGVSFGLSVLTVVFFAVVLYQPDHHPGHPTPAAESTVEVVEAVPPPATERPHPEPAPSPTPAVAGRRPAAAGKAEPLGGSRIAAVVRGARKGAEDERSSAVAVARPVSRRIPHAAEPRGAFTQARAGETLADVAERVYGTADAAKALWHSNRDLLDRADGPLAPGALLRTP